MGNWFLNESVIYEGFSVEGLKPMFMGPSFEGRNENILLGNALKCGVIFQNDVWKLIKMWENYKKCKFSGNFLNFWKENGKNKEYYMSKL